MLLSYLQVVLKKLTMKYADEFFRVFNDKELSKLVSIPNPLKKSWVKEYIEKAMFLAEKGDRYTWGVFNKEDMFVGVVLLKRIDINNKTAELGYTMGRKYWKNGYTEMAARAVLNHCFKKLDLNRIEVRVFMGNPESCAFVERLNGKLEGVLREASFNSVGFNDMYLYSILKKDYIIG